MNRRIDAHHGEYADARVHLDDALDLLANCADIYARCDDANRRLCNQAFFTRIYLEDDDGELRVEHSHPFDMLLDPGVQADAAAWAGDGTLTAHEAQTSPNVGSGESFGLVRRVELRGFEPLTSSLRTKRATNCATAP